MEWKYRGRSGSEITSTEPLSAPTGLAAQQKEGFQRFFKAVVSPTHIRVTAGGRIVPNTRATTSPTTKWDKARVDHENQESIDTTKNGKSEVDNEVKNNTSGPAGSQVPQPQGQVQGHPQGHPVFFQHPGMPFPLVPMHNGFPMAYGFPSPIPAAPSMLQPASVNAMPEPQKTTSTAKTDDEASTNKSHPEQVKISPPTQFDHTKPFLYNGHMMFPFTGPPPMPGQGPTMIPAPFLPQGLTSDQAAMAAPRLVHMGPLPPHPHMFGPHGPIPRHPGAALPPGGALPPGASPVPGGPRAPQPPSYQARPVAGPPISSIRPSEITRQQLTQLRGMTKYYEDQLLYNKHQIDEKITENQIKELKERTLSFENNLKMQLNEEASSYPRQAQGSETMASVPAPNSAASRDIPSGPASMRLNRSDNISRTDSTTSINSGTRNHSLARNKQPLDRFPPESRNLTKRKDDGINAFKHDSNPKVFYEAITAKYDRETKNHGLPSGAAFAPPFQPGTAPSAPSVSGNAHGATQPLPAGVYNQQQQSASTFPLRPQEVWDTTNSTAMNVAGGSTPSDPQTSTDAFGSSSMITPYLVGVLPRGVNAYNARATDYIYPRELTDAEMRARHVYWGGVSVKGTGLPKFDGKDFYPSSPKAEEKPQQQAQVPTGRPGADYGNRLSSTENDPFRSSRDGTSIRSQEGIQKASRAIPIVNPDSIGRVSKAPSPTSVPAPNMGRDLTNALDEMRLDSPATELTTDERSSMPKRRAIERSR